MRQLAPLLLLVTACASDAPQELVSGPPERPAPKVLPQDAVRMDFSQTPATTTTTHYHPPTTTTAVPVMSNISPTTAPQTNSTNCGGWEGLVAEFFPDEVGTACRVLVCESQGNPNAVSPTDDHGLMQLNRPSWQRRFQEVTGVPFFDGVYDPVLNLRFAAWLRNAAGWNQWACY